MRRTLLMVLLVSVAMLAASVMSVSASPYPCANCQFSVEPGPAE